MLFFGGDLVDVFLIIVVLKDCLNLLVYLNGVEFMIVMWMLFEDGVLMRII